MKEEVSCGHSAPVPYSASLPKLEALLEDIYCILSMMMNYAP